MKDKKYTQLQRIKVLEKVVSNLYVRVKQLEDNNKNKE